MTPARSLQARSIGNIKPLFTCTPVGASPHPARVPLRHRVPSPSRASGWPALDAAGRPQASTAPTGPGDGEAARLWRRRGERQGYPKGGRREESGRAARKDWCKRTTGSKDEHGEGSCPRAATIRTGGAGMTADSHASPPTGRERGHHRRRTRPWLLGTYEAVRLRMGLQHPRRGQVEDQAKASWRTRAGAMGGGSTASFRCRRIFWITSPCVMAAMIRSAPR
jgi:hypothetical protein